MMQLWKQITIFNASERVDMKKRVVFCVSVGLFFCTNMHAMKEEQEPRVLANPWGARTYDPSSGDQACAQMGSFSPRISKLITFMESKKSYDLEMGHVIERDVRWWVEKCQVRAVMQDEYAAAPVARRRELEEELKVGDMELLAAQRKLMNEWSVFTFRWLQHRFLIDKE